MCKIGVIVCIIQIQTVSRMAPVLMSRGAADCFLRRQFQWAGGGENTLNSPGRHILLSLLNSINMSLLHNDVIDTANSAKPFSHCLANSDVSHMTGQLADAREHCWLQGCEGRVRKDLNLIDNCQHHVGPCLRKRIQENWQLFPRVLFGLSRMAKTCQFTNVLFQTFSYKKLVFTHLMCL